MTGVKVEKKKWTFMVYLAGVNDLAEDMTKRVIDMRTFFNRYKHKAKVDNINLLVYFATDNPVMKTRVFNLNSSTEPQPINSEFAFTANTPGSVITYEAAIDNGEADINNSANKYTIEGFVRWCIEEEQALADHYVLLLAGHGDGFQQTTFMKDMKSGDSLTIQGVKEILDEINKNILKVPKLDVLAFDSCVMNTIEIANEMKDVAEVMVGSQGYMPTTGWCYRQFVERLLNLDKRLAAKEISSISRDDVVLAMLSAVNSTNKEMSELYRRSTDLTAIDLDNVKLARAGDAINGMAARLKTALEKDPPDVPGARPVPRKNRSRKDILVREPLLKAILSAHWKCQTFLFDQSIDIIDFCFYMQDECETVIEEYNEIVKVQNVPSSSDISETIATFEGIAESCRTAMEAVEECVIVNGYSGPDYQYAKGISTIFPWNRGTLDMITPLLKEFGFFSAPAEKETNGGPPKPKESAWIEFINVYLDQTCRVVGKSDDEVPDQAANGAGDLKMKAPAKMAVSAKIPICTASSVKSFNTEGIPEDMVSTFSAAPPALADRVMLDPPPRSQLISEGLYKAYFRRMKNFSLFNTGRFPSKVFRRSNGTGNSNNGDKYS